MHKRSLLFFLSFETVSTALDYAALFRLYSIGINHNDSTVRRHRLYIILKEMRFINLCGLQMDGTIMK